MLPYVLNDSFMWLNVLNESLTNLNVLNDSFSTFNGPDEAFAGVAECRCARDQWALSRE